MLSPDDAEQIDDGNRKVRKTPSDKWIHVDPLYDDLTQIQMEESE